MISSPALLLCIDLQPVFLAGIAGREKVQKRCSFAIEAASGLRLPILFTEQVPAKLGHTASEILALCAQPEAIAKESFSAFGDEKIVGRIQAGGAKHLLICGIETPICIYQSARDALKAGFQVTVLADCVGARRDADAANALAHLAQSGCTILSAETVFYAVLENANHAFFRDFTLLVKKYA
jgi:nicotinamidase-related amidase